MLVRSALLVAAPLATFSPAEHGGNPVAGRGEG
jgi:hypothetical protein